MPPALAIFTKTPGLSPLKTRLANAIGQEAALQFHHLAATATAEVAATVEPSLTPYWALAEDDALARETWHTFPCIVQGPGGLGERMHRVYGELHDRHGTVLLIGTDIPQVTPAMLVEAVTLLASPGVDCVLGPALDGGFWLFGGKRAVAAQIWREVRYSVPETGNVFYRLLSEYLQVEQLRALADVDTAEDLPLLEAELTRLASPTPGQCRLLDWLRAATWKI